MLRTVEFVWRCGGSASQRLVIKTKAVLFQIAKNERHDPPRQNRRFSTEFNFSPEPMFFLTVELVLNLKLNFFLSILEPFLPSS